MNYFIETLKSRNEVLFYFGAVCLLGAIFCMIMVRVSNIQVMGINAYIKPLKFCLSTVIFSWSMGWYLGYLEEGFDIKLFNWVVVICLGFEIIYIALQAGKGQLSHYNMSTTWHAGMYSLMAMAATLVTLFTAFIGIKFLSAEVYPLPAYYKLAIQAGIFLFVIFSFQGFSMGAKMTHTIGGPDGTRGLPFVNWSLSKGDLRVAHFIGMHALQVIPILAYYVLRNTFWVIFTIALYALFATFTLIQAFQGRPFLKI